MAEFKGRCRDCKQDVCLKMNETLFLHLKPGIYYRTKRPCCIGSGKYPAFKWRIKDAKD